MDGGPHAAPANPERAYACANVPPHQRLMLDENIRTLQLPSALHSGEPLQAPDDARYPTHTRPLIYELPGLPHRRLRRWPQRATAGKAATFADERFPEWHAEHDPWPVLEPQRWLWDE